MTMLGVKKLFDLYAIDLARIEPSALEQKF
jgi:hypothetical protein